MAGLKRHASGVWRKSLRNGAGAMTTASGALQETPFTFESRFGDERQTNPEELISAALAGCYSMAFANHLDRRSYKADEIRTRATAEFEDGRITRMHLDVEGRVPEIDQEAFTDLAREAEEKCPVASLLRNSLDVTLEASLNRQASG